MFYKSTDDQVYVCKGTTLGWKPASGGISSVTSVSRLNNTVYRAPLNKLTILSIRWSGEGQVLSDTSNPPSTIIAQPSPILRSHKHQGWAPVRDGNTRYFAWYDTTFTGDAMAYPGEQDTTHIILPGSYYEVTGSVLAITEFQAG